MHKWFFRTAVAAIASVSLISAAGAEDAKTRDHAKPHRLLIQVDQNDPAVMNLALNNATNVIEYYRAKGGTSMSTSSGRACMLRADTSPVKTASRV